MISFLEAVQKTLIERFGLKSSLHQGIILAWAPRGFIVISETEMSYVIGGDVGQFNFNVADPAFDPEKIFAIIEKHTELIKEHNKPEENWDRYQYPITFPGIK